MSGLTEWRDTTNYSRGDKKRVPTSYTIKHGYLSISITCGHIYHRPDYVLHCHAVGIDTQPLTVLDGKYQFKADDDLDTVKTRAIEIVEERIKKILYDIKVIKEVSE